MSNVGHHEFAPSSLVPRYYCACFKPGGSSEYADEGTRKHAILAKMLSLPAGCQTEEEGYKEETAAVREELDFCYDAVMESARAKKHVERYGNLPSRFVEQRLYLQDDNFNDILFGTLDVFLPPLDADDDQFVDLTDWKFGNELHDYRAQLFAYAICAMQRTGTQEARIRVVYGARKHVAQFIVSWAEASQLVFGIIRKCQDPGRSAIPNEYCTWCDGKLECPALTSLALKVAAEREDWDISTFHSSEITEPEEMAKALTLAKLLKKWIDAVEHHAKEMVLGGTDLPGFKAQKSGSKRTIPDIVAAFTECNLVGLDPALFVSGCSLSAAKLEAIFSEAEGLSKAKAKVRVEELVGNLIVHGKEGISLRAISQKV